MDGKTKVCGIIANPVEHSMSPVLQNLFAERTGVNLAYVPFKIEPEQLEEAVRGAYAMNILGLNVTVPHKQAVMRCVKELDETAAGRTGRIWQRRTPSTGGRKSAKAAGCCRCTSL